MSGHTPGPWELDGVEIYPVNGHRASDAICQLSAGQSDEAFEANARLIAAAPELLKALAEAQGVFQGLADGGLSCTARELADKYAAVLAKARGL